jgi:hypothetical protein
MEIPPEQLIREAIVTRITPVEGERGLYRVDIEFDGKPEVFHIELEGAKSSFIVRERVYYKYCMRSMTLKGIVPLMRQWHRGEYRSLPVELGDVGWR